MGDQPVDLTSASELDLSSHGYSPRSPKSERDPQWTSLTEGACSAIGPRFIADCNRTRQFATKDKPPPEANDTSPISSHAAPRTIAPFSPQTHPPASRLWPPVPPSPTSPASPAATGTPP